MGPDKSTPARAEAGVLMMFLVKFVGGIVLVTSVFWIVMIGLLSQGKGR